MLLGTTTLTRQRFGAQTIGTDGRGVPGATASDPITASVQPARGEDLQLLPEGMRQQQVIKLYTPAELRTADQYAGTPPDRVVLASAFGGVDAGTYQVQLVKPWPALLTHHFALATRLQEAV